MNLANRLLMIAGLAAALTAHADEATTAKGQHVFGQWCSACHGPGADKPGTTGLAAKYNGRLAAQLEQRTDLTPAMIKQYVRHGFAMMPPFRKTEIGEADLDALCVYLSNKKK